MELKTYSLSPNQLASLQSLAESKPEKFALPVNDGRPAFVFAIEDVNQVAKTLAIADTKRPVDWTKLDVSEELLEFDASWIDSEGTVKINNIELQFQEGTKGSGNIKIEPADLDLILHRSGFDADTFCETGDNWEEHKSDLLPAIVVWYLTRPEDETE